jgi:hypothetical protein
LKFIRKFFEVKGDQQPDKKDKVVFYRSKQSSAQTEPDRQQRLFIEGVAVVLQCKPSDVNLNARLVEDLGCADLDISECVQIAEEIWGIQLMPNPMKVADYAQMMKTFPTLKAIITVAEAKR